MKYAMWKTTIREIKQSLGRFLAIFAIVTLGVSMFAGLRITRPFMLETTESYLTEKSLYDFRLLSSYGFEEQDVEYLSGNEGIRQIQGAYTYDVLTKFDGAETSAVMKLHSITEKINELEIVYGRLPERSGECVVDSGLYGEEAVGKTILITEENEEDTLDCFPEREFTVTGVVKSSYYMHFERGNTSLGNGTVAGFMYVLPEAVDSDIYTEIFVKLDQDLPIYSDDYEEMIEAESDIWEERTEIASRMRFDRIIKDAEEELADAKEEFAKEKADAEKELEDAAIELADAEVELSDARIKIEDAKEEIRDGYQELAEKEKELLDGEKELLEQEQELLEKEQELKDGLEEWNINSRIVNENEEKLLDAQKLLDQSEAELLAGEDQLLQQENTLKFYLGMLDPVADKDMYDYVAAKLAEIDAAKTELASQKLYLSSQKAEVENGLAKLSGAKAQLSLAIMHIWDGERQIEEGKEAIADAKAELEDGKVKLSDAKEELADAETELADAEIELADGEREYQDGLEEYQEGLAEFEAEIADAEIEIADAEKDLQELEPPETYVLGRDTNMGYACMESDSSIIADVAEVFPVFFFLIAALVCMTTMNRMIEEQRTQIGVLKALGYSNGAIMTKYLFYSGTAAFCGCVTGYVLGTIFFPEMVWFAYGIMYDVTDLVYYMDWGLAIVSLTASLLCSVGVTWYSCRQELVHVAAVLMRPKSPKAGKRVIFEYIPFLWKRLKFIQKVSIRNVLRYKKRFIMMIIGISGCTALLVAGFGILDSVQEVVTMQYEEIMLYDMSVTFNDHPEDASIKEFEEITAQYCDKVGRFLETSMDFTANGITKSAYLVVPQEPERIEEFICLQTQEGEKVTFPGEGEVVLTYKLAENLGVQVGDQITLADEDRESFTVTVSDICKNFIFNYAYLHPDTCRSSWKEPAFKSGYLTMDFNKEEMYQVSARLLQIDDVSSVTVNLDVRARFNNMMVSLNYVVVVIIFCAAALAFIVLYNLTNINITERIREIATIKVLGFTKKETASYVFRENLMLTVLGAFAGLFLGKFFHAFIMSCIHLEMVTFDVRIKSVSYLYSFLLTVLFAWFVNKFMTGKIEKISMTESLKSVD